MLRTIYSLGQGHTGQGQGHTGQGQNMNISQEPKIQMCDNVLWKRYSVR